MNKNYIMPNFSNFGESLAFCNGVHDLIKSNPRFGYKDEADNFKIKIFFFWNNLYENIVFQANDINNKPFVLKTKEISVEVTMLIYKSDTTNRKEFNLQIDYKSGEVVGGIICRTLFNSIVPTREKTVIPKLFSIIQPERAVFKADTMEPFALSVDV